MFKSIRSRLALSFAGIALVAAIALGAVLLVILKSYYQDLEVSYLRGNAQTIGSVVEKMTSSNAPRDELQSQIENLSFLTQTRIQVYSTGKQLLYDSGSPRSVNVNLATAKQFFVESNGALPKGSLGVISVFPQSSSKPAPPDGAITAVPVPADGSLPESGSKSVMIYRSVQAVGSPFGFDLSAEAVPLGARSSLTMSWPLQDPQHADVVGLIQLSEGPAYGNQILRSVAAGWLMASALAVLLAALIGWFISRRISAPVLALTQTTARMAHGDLSSRAHVQSRDEFGQLAHSFNEMADQVETTVNTLRRFVSDAAHELRTPLTALRTDLDLALDDRNVQDRELFVTRAQAMVRRLEQLNNNLLDLSRLEANDRAARVEDLDMTALLRERIELYASQAEQAGLSFEADCPPAPIPVRGDASQLTRAMDNLLDNACKFTAQGGTIRVALSEQDGQALLSVADSGIGIPADELPQIFNRFHRGRNTNAYPGSGLGLAIVRAIAAAHGGKVEVQSAGEGQGSQFSMRLPCIAPEIA